MTPDLQTKYLEQCLADLGLTNASPEEQAKVLEMVSDRLQDVIMLTLIRLANSEQQKRLEAALKMDPIGELEITKVAAEIPGLQEVLEEVLADEYESLVFDIKS